MATGRTGRRSGIAALLMLLTLLWGGALPHAQEAAQPAISAPVTGGARGEPFGTAAGDLPAGYVEEERLLSGTARSYSKVGRWEIDGRWEAQPAREAAYTVRMLVRRPADPADFNGVAVVEWLNVSPMFETAADYAHLEAELVRGGYVWVGVGAQSAGVNAPRTGLKAWDPDRYRPLAHPGDAFSYDIFSQAIRALRRTPEAAPAGGPDVAPVVHPLDGFAIRHVIAAGRSQSAMRLVTYVNAVHPRTGLPDGYLIHSRGGTPAGLTADRLTGAADPMPAGAHVRTDVGAPVLDVQAEGDLVVLRSHLARQAPHARLRRWEIAGAAHAEIPRWVVSDASPPDSGPGCATPVNAAPHDAVTKAALRALVRWVRDGVAPPQSPPLAIGDPAADDPIVRDRFGNARGGIRLPQLEAPTATLDGRRNAMQEDGDTGGIRNFCFLFGRTVPFDRETLAALYPDHDAFVSRFNGAVDRLVREGYLLEAEAESARRAALESPIGR